MLVCHPYEIIIHGTTSTGKIFRPSDWAERLCGILSTFDKDYRMADSEQVRPLLVDNVRCVSVDQKLEETNPQMFRFLMDFAADNDLRVINCNDLLAEQQLKTPEQIPVEHVLLTQAIEEKHSLDRLTPIIKESDTTESVLREIQPHETAIAFAALSVLRDSLTDINGFVEQINTHQRNAGYRLLGIFEGNKQNAVAVCGFHEDYNLSSGRHIQIDDLVTIPQSRHKGYATQLLQEVKKIAAETGVGHVLLSVYVSHDRAPAHRLYFKNDFEIRAYHFRYLVNR